MPGGRLNPFSVMGQFGDTADKAKDKKHEKSSSLRQKMSGSTTPYVDLSIKVKQVQVAAVGSFEYILLLTVYGRIGTSQDGCGRVG